MPNPDRFRCPNCRTRRTDGHAMLLHLLACKQVDCTCGGYHFKHRRGGGMCFENPESLVKHAERAGTEGEELLDVQADIAFNVKGKVRKVCPF